MKLFAITHKHKCGLRGLTFANQGRNHYPSKAIAEEALDAFKKGGLDRVLTPEQMASLRVDEVDCYPHGDAIGVWVDDS